MPNAGRVTDAEITPPETYVNRRAFLRAGVAAASVLATGYVYRKVNKVSSGGAETAALAGLSTTQPTGAGFVVEGEATTSLEAITHYNNFYEFTTDKESVAEASAKFTTAGWKIAVDGLCAKPREFDLDDLAKISAPEQRVYRMRCVEAWSMVIPWAGFSLSKLLEKVEPQSGAKYVAFTTLMDPTRFPGQRSQTLNWPYVEGLRMDEAMHPLTLLATGLYGKALPPQDGAPVRLVVPWKYGFKGIKSIVKISLVADLPRTTWAETNPAEYGFYANVNPQHDHPRWTQANERRIGESGRRDTLMFNGYADEVGSLYAGMDLHKFF